MAVTELDPKTALIIVDLQKGIVGLPCAHPMPAIVEQSAKLAQAFRAKGRPVVLVNVTGVAPGRNEQPPHGGAWPDDFAELIPELDVQPSDLKITKRTWGAFVHTDLDAQLKALGVTQVVLAGVATSIGVESTARQAYEYGYNVTLATDAMTDRSAEAHDNSVQRIFPRLGETGASTDIIALL
ncbi:isochorismatase family protein [Oleiagrimonas sp. C23AA]|uniref:isochorismatase family protein n=1 Tax=Oleiagrimonas sp. C23AA TaxID=2719047 RepID=UPI0014233241|nr:isochorismatase family protein [Oleiagrimonas sp. C23AA]NII09564.1 isochorismatase family protein [Oleiagrimonas sp. C23AA]